MNDETKAYIEEKLSLKWSPRQIASQIEKDTGHYISYPTIYRYIRNGLVKVDVKRDMRQAGKKYNKSSEKRGKLDVGSRVIKYRLKKVLIIVKNLGIMKLILFGVLDHQHIAC